jgi:hypothetical protein
MADRSDEMAAIAAPEFSAGEAEAGSGGDPPAQE